MNNYLEVPMIEKPLHPNYVCVRVSYINQAIREGKMMKVSSPDNEAVVDPKEWATTGKRMEKEFLIKGHPMILYCNYIPVSTDKPDVEQLSLL